MSLPGIEIAFVGVMFLICLFIFSVFFCLQLGAMKLWKGKRAAMLPLGLAAVVTAVDGLGWLILGCFAPDLRLELSLLGGMSMPAFRAALNGTIFAVSALCGCWLGRFLIAKQNVS